MTDILHDFDAIIRIRVAIVDDMTTFAKVDDSARSAIKAILESGYRIVKAADPDWGEFSGQPKLGERSGFGIRRVGCRDEAIQRILTDSDPKQPIYELITVEAPRSDLIAELERLREDAE